MAETEDSDTGTTASQPVPDATPAAPAPPPPATPAPRSRQGAAFLGGLVGGLIAAAAGFGLAKYVPGGWPIADTSALEAQVAALQVTVADLSDRLDKAAAPQADTALADRVAKLETAMPAPDLSAQVAALKDQVAALAARPAATVDEGALKALQDQVAALAAAPSAMTDQVRAQLDDAVKAAQDQLALATAAAEAKAQALAQLGAFRQLSAALDSGGAYAAALKDLAAQNLPAVLTDHAETGLPTLQQLRDAFPDAARAALDAARRADMGASWTDRVATFLQTQTGARSLEPREGNDPDAILSRAQAAVDKGDVATALTELAALPEQATAAMADWIASARLRLQAQAALADLAKALGQ
jgi:hypothetical protein